MQANVRRQTADGRQVTFQTDPDCCGEPSCKIHRESSKEDYCRRIDGSEGIDQTWLSSINEESVTHAIFSDVVDDFRVLFGHYGKKNENIAFFLFLLILM